MAVRSGQFSRRHSLPVLPLIDRMLFGELAKTLLVVLLILASIIISKKFLAILVRAIEGEIASETIFMLLALKLVAVFTSLLPAALFTSIMIVLGRMYRDNEMVSLVFAGMSPLTLIRGVMLFTLPVAVLAGFLSLEIMPWSERAGQQLIKADEKLSDLRSIKPGRFNEFRQGDVVLYAESMDFEDETMHDIFVQSRQGDATGVIIAEKAHLETHEDDEHFLVLEKGRRYQGIPGRSDYVISTFDAYGLRIDAPGHNKMTLKRDGTASSELWSQSQPRDLAELFNRIGVPVSCVLLGLMAIPLSKTRPREGSWKSLLTAFLCYIVYENGRKILQSQMISGKIGLATASLSLYLVTLLILTVLMSRQNGWLRMTKTPPMGGA